MNNKKRLISIIGWYGTIAIILAYLLNNFNILSSNNIIYQLLNLTGAVGIIIETFSKKDYQPVVLNIVWCHGVEVRTSFLYNNIHV